jgi:hypothetical protein
VIDVRQRHRWIFFLVSSLSFWIFQQYTMKFLSTPLSFIALLACATNAYNSPSFSRREAWTRVAFGAAAALVPMSSAAQAMDACPPNSKNCIRTTWTPPAGTSKADMAKTVKAVLDAYPQEGASLS